jgi:hypothetical protein
MKKFYIEDLYDVAEKMYDEIVENEKEEVMFVGYYDDAIEVIKCLMIFDDVMPHSLEIRDVEWEGYDKEYYVSLDENLELWVEPAIGKKGEYLMTVVDTMFMTGDCSSKILHKVDAYEVFEVVFFGEEDFEDDCSDCCRECICHGGCNEESDEFDNNSVKTRVALDEDGNVRGFEKTWITEEDGMRYYSKYEHYSNNGELIRKLMDNFDINFK